MHHTVQEVQGSGGRLPACDTHATSVCVCIATFRRPEGLRRLLLHLLHLQFAKVPRPKLRIVVVDNDAEQSARDVVEDMIRESPIEISYRCEPQLGEAHARNAGLEAAGTTCDFVCLIDDDEWPAPLWLDELLAVQARWQADSVSGAVITVPPPGTARWLVRAGMFERRSRRSGSSIDFLHGGNALIARSILARTGIRFDPSLLHTGGSDSLFARQLKQQGANLRWSDEAIVFEEMSPHRARLSWLLQRNFRYGNTAALTLMIANVEQWRGIMRSLFLLSALIFKGLPTSIGLAALRGLMDMILKLSIAAGVMAGLFGFRYHEYSPKRMNKDRMRRSQRR